VLTAMHSANSRWNKCSLVSVTIRALLYYIVVKVWISFFFPDNKEVRYSVISGFIFLRFFAPAILGPKLFDLTTEQIVSIYRSFGVELA
jgi:GTPase-activator protein for Ras-like GTPase.